MPAASRRGDNLTPAMAGAVGLHMAVLLAGLVSWPWKSAPPVTTGVTTVSIIDAPAAEMRPAVEAEDVAPAQTEAPVPDAPADSPAPTPAPVAPPPPPKAAPVVKAAPQPTPKLATQPAPRSTPKAAPKQARAEPDFLDSLTKSLTASSKAGGGRSSAQKGANRPETAQAAREGQGAADAALADATAMMKSRLMRAWRPNCGVEGANEVVVKVKFTLAQDGRLIGPAEAQGRAPNPVWQAAADRAESAVGRAAPFSEFPKSQYARWKTWEVEFVGATACRYQ